MIARPHMTEQEGRTLGRVLKLQRKAMGLSVESVAQLTQERDDYKYVSRRSIIRIEANEISPTLDQVRALVVVLNLTRQIRRKDLIPECPT